MNTPEFKMEYKNPSWSEDYTFAIGILGAALILLLFPIISSIIAWKFHIVTMLVQLVSIPFFIFTFIVWPYIPSTIRVFSNCIIFNEKVKTRLRNPIIEINYSDVKSCAYHKTRDINEIQFITRIGNKNIVNLIGARNEDINRLIEILERKGIKVVRKS
jgi:hypothetical protein